MPGRVVRAVEIPARHGAALEVPRGLVLRVIDVEGQQVGDFVCFNRDDLGERYSPQNTVLFNRTIYPKVGAVLVSDRGRPMMRLIADTVGVHDLICGSCSEEYYRSRLELHGAPPELPLEPGGSAGALGDRPRGRAVLLQPLHAVAGPARRGGAPHGGPLARG